MAISCVSCCTASQLGCTLMCQWPATFTESHGCNPAPSKKPRRLRRSLCIQSASQSSEQQLLVLAAAQARRAGCIIEPIERDGRCLFSCVEAIQGWEPLSAPGKFEAWLLENESLLQDNLYMRVFLGLTNAYESRTIRTTRWTTRISYQKRVQKCMHALETEPQTWWYNGSDIFLQFWRGGFNET